MANNGVKTVGFIGFADAYGEGWYHEFSKIAAIKRHPDRRQRALCAHRHLGDRPGAQADGRQARRGADRRLGHAGRAAAEDAQGARLHRQDTTRPTASPTPTSCASAARTSTAPSCPPARCWWPSSCRPTTRCASRRWPTSPPTKPRTARARCRPSARHAWDAGMLMAAAVPAALKKAQPGTPEFRAALRDALEAGQGRAPARTASSACRRPTTSAWTSAPA